MNPKNLKEQIFSELDFSIKYLNYAIETAKSNPDYSESYKSISDSKYAIATVLYKIFLDMYLSNTKDTYVSSLKDIIIDKISVSNIKIKELTNVLDIANKLEEVPYDSDSGRHTKII